MNKIWMTGLASLAASAVMAQTATILYAPVRVIKDQNIGLKAWGSGTASETDEIAYEGAHSIRISTRNYFAGGSLNFGNVVALSDKFGDKNNMLRITYRAADSAMTFGPGGGPGAGGPGAGPGLGGPGGPGAGGGPGKGGGGGKGGDGGAAGRGGGVGGPGGPGAGGFGGGPQGGGTGGGRQGGGLTGPGQGGPGAGGFGGGSAAATAQKLQNIRMIVTTTDGKKSEAYVPVATSGSGDKGWRTVAIPLQAISGFDRTNKEVRSIAFAGDVTTTFYIGDLRVVNDTTPITGDVNVHEMNLALGDFYTFNANGYGGSSILKYSWDFDDRDGIQEDAVGQSVKRQFRKPGNFTITLTITDSYGLKRPYTTTIKAKVNP